MPSCSPQSYIHGSSQAQFVAESHIILLLSILYVERKCFIMRFIQVGWYWRCRHNGFPGKPFFVLLSLMSRHDTFFQPGHPFRVKAHLKWPQRQKQERWFTGGRRNTSCFLQSPTVMEASAPLLLGYVPLPKVLQTSEHFSRRKWSRTEHPNILISSGTQT